MSPAPIMCTRCGCEWREDALCSAASFSVICAPSRAWGSEAPVEQVDHPAHYHAGSGIEVIDAISAWGLGFCLGNVVKYCARAGHKDPERALEDLRKARWYLSREIEERERAAR